MASSFDLFRLFNLVFSKDPLSAVKNKKNFPSAGVKEPDSIPDIRGSGFGANAGAFIRVQNDLIDVTATSNRLNRYKEYDRLANTTPEIDVAMTVFADETCIAYNTPVYTLFYGPKPIKWLAYHQKEKFAVYCYDFEKNDFTIGWAYNPRFTKRCQTLRLFLSDGTNFSLTPDHKVLKEDGVWTCAGDLQEGDYLMHFDRQPARPEISKCREGLTPRIRSRLKGWMSERMFLDYWRYERDLPKYDEIIKVFGLVDERTDLKAVRKMYGKKWQSIRDNLTQNGFSLEEIKMLQSTPPELEVLKIERGGVKDVYDLSVEKYENFCAGNTVVHNCQKDAEGRVFKIQCDNKQIQKELEHLFFNRNMLNFSQRDLWDKARRLFIKGDQFWELIIDPDNPKAGIQGIQDLPCDSMYRIETTKGKLIEFQQGKEGPDLLAIEKAPVATATDAELAQSTAIRFAPEQIVHTRIGDYRKSFYPYGVSLIEAAKGNAHNLRILEDSCVVYRLCIAGHERVTTDNGYKFMKDVEIGDTVYSFNRKTKKLEPTKVINKMYNGKKKVYKVSSNGMNIRATDNHPILVKDKITGNIDYVQVKDLIIKRHQLIHVQDEFNKPKKIQRFFGPTYARLSKIEKDKYWERRAKYGIIKNICGECLREHQLPDTSKEKINLWHFLSLKDTVSIPVNIARTLCKKVEINPDTLILQNEREIDPLRINVPEYMTEEFSRLLGFLTGDGWVSKRKTGTLTDVSFSTGVYEHINQRYADSLKKYFSYCSFTQAKGKAIGLGKYIVSSTAAAEIVYNLGINARCYYKRIQPWMFNENKNIRYAFVKGLADAEGSKGNQKITWATRIKLSNRELINDIVHIWNSLDYRCSSPRLIPGGPHEILGIKTIVKDCWETRISEVKIDEYEDVLTIEEQDPDDVYDITVDHEEHNFICNGMPVHNCRSAERRCFFIDIGQLPPFKAEAFMDRIKDQFKKKKVTRNHQVGASAVEERYHTPAIDEDYWIPLRPNSSTRIETLPGATSLGEIGDIVYFRRKLFVALGMPINYMEGEDIQSSRVTLSSRDVKFARLVERLQSYLEDSIWVVADRHLKLLGVPEEAYEDLEIKFTAPSPYRELSFAEVLNNRISAANSLKGSQIYSLYDTLTKILQHSEDEAKEIISRVKIEKIEDLKLQILAQNPVLLGVGTPGQDENEVGSEPGGPSPMLGGEAPQQPGMPEENPEQQPQQQQPQEPPSQEEQVKLLPDADRDDILKFDLEIEDYDSEQDYEDFDYSEI